MEVSDAVYALAYAGVGSGLGTIIAAVVSARSQRGPARAQAADLLTEAAERVSNMNHSLDRENRHLRRDLEDLSDAVCDYLDGTLGEDELRAVLRHARFGS